MPTVVTQATVDDAALAALLAPRDDVVAEHPAEGPASPGPGTWTFALREGPMQRYARTVDVAPAGGHGSDRWAVHQRVDYRLALRWFRPVFALAVRAALRRAPAPGRQPWWAPPQRLDARAAGVLDVLAAASLTVGYLNTLLTQTVAFAADEFGSSESAQGVALAVVRAGVLLALGLVALADRRGRRRVVLGTVAAAPVLAAAGALAPSLAWLTASQALGRPLALCLGIVVGIIAAEEVPAGSRAYATSLLAMATALGAGLCVMALPLADLGLRAWRGVYVLPLAGLALVPAIARRLPESRRFAAPHARARFAGHGRRLALLATSGLLTNLFVAPASSFQNRYLRDERGFSASRISLFTLATGTPGGIGIIVGGRLADLRGRRLIGAVALAGGATATAVSFLVGGWALWAVSVAGSVVGAAAIPSLGVYGAELFPTGLRARAGGAITVATLAGSALGLVLVGTTVDRTGRFGPVLAALAVAPLLVAGLVLARYPETAQRELEELNPEDAAVARPATPPTSPPPSPPRRRSPAARGGRPPPTGA